MFIAANDCFVAWTDGPLIDGYNTLADMLWQLGVTVSKVEMLDLYEDADQSYQWSKNRHLPTAAITGIIERLIYAYVIDLK